ncbi:MAG: hypothetical protein AAF518_22005 [Spirochaetota bacterium]
MEISCVKKEENYLLKITVEENAVGIVYKVAAVLYRYHWHILEAVIETVPGSLIKDVFIIQGREKQDMTEEILENIQTDFAKLLYSDNSLAEYINEFNTQLWDKNNKQLNNSINLFNPPTIDTTVLDIQTNKSPEKLLLITGLLYTASIDIASLIVKTDVDFERYSFLLKKENGEKLDPKDLNSLEGKLRAVV